MTPGIAALEALARRARDELALFDYPDRAWVTSVHDGNGDPVHNVLVAGGGQNGLAIAFALRRECINGVTVLDENPPGQEGPWVTYARMLTLRTLKFLTGPDLGVAALTFRARHEAQYGEESWNDPVRIPRQVCPQPSRATYYLWPDRRRPRLARHGVSSGPQAGRLPAGQHRAAALVAV